jgi:hypothetical protein
MLQMMRDLMLVLALCRAVEASAQTSTPPYQGSGTRRMAERLQKIAHDADPAKDMFLTRERAEVLRAQIATNTSAHQFIELQQNLAKDLLRSGQSAEALAAWQTLEDRVREWNMPFDARNRAILRIEKALCHLRLGEQANCVLNPTTESCLMPISPGGVHRDQRGSRAAVELLTETLRESPDNLKACWLLNIALMTLGEYPEKAPSNLVIPPSAFASSHDIKHFTNVAAGVGLELFGWAGGVIMDDFDNDGYLDVMVSSWDLNEQLRLFRNNADGTFSDRTAQAGLTGVVGGLNIMQTDYNNDGFLDVLVLRGAWRGEGGCHPNSLLRNNGNGTFDDVTEEAGLLSFHPTQTAVWFDFNNDGWLDLFIGNETVRSNALHRCELYRNNGNGTFTECGAEAGIAHLAFVKAVASADFNGDRLPDLYLSCRGSRNALYRNDGARDGSKDPKAPWKFTNVALAAGVTEPIFSFPSWFFDYDNDGWPDLFVAGYNLQSVGDIAADYLGLPYKSERARLFHNNRDGTFTDVSKAAQLDKILLGMGSNFGDLDNDGWLDFYLGTGDPDLATLIPNRMFRNARGKFFQDVTTSGGFGHLQKGHGVAFGDIDNDGDQDIYEDMGGAYPGDVARNVFFENPGHGHHWITLKLEGIQSNRAAIGARIKATIREKGGQREVYKTVCSGGSFGASPLRQEIGLGQAEGIESIEIFWPRTGKTQTVKGLAMDRFYKVREGESTATSYSLKTFKMPRGNGPEVICAPPVAQKTVEQSTSRKN